MPQETKISDRVSDFLFTTLWLSLLNYFEVFVNYADHTKRLTKSILVAAAAGMVLALIRPYINAWIKPIIKRNKNTNAGILLRFIIFTLFFGTFLFVSLLHYREDAGWSMSKILMVSASAGALSALFFTALFWVIKKLRGNGTSPNLSEGEEM